MDKILILYKSKYGATEKYACMLVYERMLPYEKNQNRMYHRPRLCQ